jgi:hypothetical protein
VSVPLGEHAVLIQPFATPALLLKVLVGVAQWTEPAMELYWAEKVIEAKSASTERCLTCGEKLELVRTIVDADTGNIIHMFRCSCGERTWRDDTDHSAQHADRLSNSSVMQ